MSTKKGPWTVVGTKSIYKNPWMDVREDKVIRPDGKDGIYGIVRIKPGVTILPMDNEGNVFLVEQYRYTTESKTVEAVSGGVENNESALDAGKRELKEEAGIEAKEWIELGEFYPMTTIVESKNYLFLAKDLTFSKAIPDGTENIKLFKISLNQAIEWIMEGKITNSVTATILFKVKNLL